MRRRLAWLLTWVAAAAAWRIVLRKLGVTDAWVHVVTGMLVGVLVPMLLYRMAPRLRIGWLFEWRRPVTRASKPSAESAPA